MPERIPCRQVSENSRTFPPFEKGGPGGISHEKGGSGGIAIFYIPQPSPSLPDKASPSPLPFLPLLAACENPPGPLWERGIFGVLQKGEIFGVFFSLMKSPRPPLVKGEVFEV
jgi:hypothetical protein